MPKARPAFCPNAELKFEETSVPQTIQRTTPTVLAQPQSTLLSLPAEILLQIASYLTWRGSDGRYDPPDDFGDPDLDFDPYPEKHGYVPEDIIVTSNGQKSTRRPLAWEWAVQEGTWNLGLACKLLHGICNLAETVCSMHLRYRAGDPSRPAAQGRKLVAYLKIACPNLKSFTFESSANYRKFGSDQQLLVVLFQGLQTFTLLQVLSLRIFISHDARERCRTLVELLLKLPHLKVLRMINTNLRTAHIESMTVTDYGNFENLEDFSWTWEAGSSSQSEFCPRFLRLFNVNKIRRISLDGYRWSPELVSEARQLSKLEELDISRPERSLKSPAWPFEPWQRAIDDEFSTTILPFPCALNVCAMLGLHKSCYYLEADLDAGKAVCPRCERPVSLQP